MQRILIVSAIIALKAYSVNLVLREEEYEPEAPRNYEITGSRGVIEHNFDYNEMTANLYDESNISKTNEPKTLSRTSESTSTENPEPSTVEVTEHHHHEGGEEGGDLPCCCGTVFMACVPTCGCED